MKIEMNDINYKLINMKSHLLVLIVLLFMGIKVNAQEQSLTALYLGYDKVDETYNFEDQLENRIDFHKVTSSVLKRINLKSEDLIFKTFRVTFSLRIQAGGGTE